MLFVGSGDGERTVCCRILLVCVKRLYLLLYLLLFYLLTHSSFQLYANNAVRVLI